MEGYLVDDLKQLVENSKNQGFSDSYVVFDIEPTGFKMCIRDSGYTVTQIRDVTEGSPAYEAGLRSGDEITGVNGKKMTVYGDYILYRVLNPDVLMETVTYTRTDEATGNKISETVAVTPQFNDERCV